MKHTLFWRMMEACDWRWEGEDQRVLAPVIESLSQQEDGVIFAFHDQMHALLYDLDTEALAEQCRRADPLMGDDSFLYSRCVALINGPEYYAQVKRGRRTDLWDMEFEALLYLPAQAWARKHRRSPEDYPHVPPLSCETGSNPAGWK